MRTLAFPIAFAVFAVALTGCLIIPTNYYLEDSRRNVSGDPLPQIAVGRTNREEVLLTLGEPDLVSDDEAQFCYTATKSIYYLLWGGYYTGGSKEFIMNYYHVITFDDHALVDSVHLYKDQKYPPPFPLTPGRNPSTREPHFSNQ